ncbi:MAG: hypothetical protein IT384_10040 [Deltaproteobacteria bacterium]|nr:hypothetical protein [Deltaproteobacteria bacterium]
MRRCTLRPALRPVSIFASLWCASLWLASLWLASLWLAACEPAPLRLELPIDPADRAVIVAWSRGAQAAATDPIQVGAADISAGGSLDPAVLPALTDVAPDEPLRVAVLGYPESLDRLGLAPGLQALAPAGQAGRPLPEAERLHLLDRSEEGETWAWTATSTRAPPEWVAGIMLVRQGEVCRPFSVRQVLLDDPSSVIFVVLTEALRVAGLESGRIFELAGPEPRWIGGPVGDAAFLTALQAPDGAFWLSNTRGEIARTALNAQGLQQIVTATRTPSGGAVRWMDGSFSGASIDELYTHSTTGVLERYAEGRWSELVRTATDNPTVGGVVRVGPDEAYAATNEGDVVHYQGGRVMRTRPLPPGQRSTAIAQIAGFGLIVGTDEGEVLQLSRDGWTSLGRPDVRQRVMTITPYGQGFVVAGTGGRVVRFSPETGLCPSQAIHDDWISRGASLGDLLLFGSQARGGRAVVFELTP